METETSGEVPASDANVTEVTAESSPAPETTEKVTADASAEATEIPKLQKRFDKLTWEKGELSRRAEQAEREAQELRRYLMQQQQPQQVAPKGPPTLAQFDYDEAKYQVALLEYVDSRASEKAQEALKADRERQQTEGRVKHFREREAEFLAKTPDYQEKVYGPEFMSIPISGEVASLIAESSDGPGIAYYLSENLPLASEIARMHPLAAAREIGKIEAKLSQPKAQPKVSAAPPPAPKIDAVEPDVKRTLDDPNLTDAQFRKIRLNQIAQRKG